MSFSGNLEFAGKTNVGSKSAFRIAIKPSDREPTDRIRMTPFELVFDVETGLLLQVLHEAKKVEFSDYRDVDGILVPFQQKSTYRYADIVAEYKIAITSIELSLKLEESLFVAPVEDDRR